MGNPPADRRPALEVVTDDYQPPPLEPSGKKSAGKRTTYKDQWIAQVMHTSLVTDSVKAFLLSLALIAMDDDGVTAIKQEDLAARLNKTVRRLYDRYEAAVTAGFLREVARGGRGGAVVYEARIPVHRPAKVRHRPASNM